MPMNPSERGADSAGMEARAARPARRPQPDPLVQRRLWELAQDVSRYLRKHASPAVRISTALLLAASLAACNASATDTTVVQQQQPGVAPLAQEVASGLPRGPGTYRVDPGSVFRDQRGVYQFEWFDPGSPTDVPGHIAHASRIRLLRDDTLALEIKAGEDPILHLPEEENVGLIQQAQVGTAQPGRQYHPQPFSFWTPFYMGMMLGGRPAYYDPPRTIVVDRDPSTLSSGGAGATIPRVSGGSSSETIKPAAQRVTGVQSAVSGRAGGTGAGSAVTNRNLGSGASTGVTSGTSNTTSSSTTGGASGAPGGTGSSVTSGGSASGSTTGSSGISSSNPNNSSASASSGVSAPRSGGFSGGTGSSGGSSVS
jgi:hypothetical protein